MTIRPQPGTGTTQGARAPRARYCDLEAGLRTSDARPQSRAFAHNLLDRHSRSCLGGGPEPVEAPRIMMIGDRRRPDA